MNYLLRMSSPIFCRSLFCLGWICLLGANADAQNASSRREPQPQVRYPSGPDSLPQDNVPKGKLEGPFLFQSQIIQNTVRKYWISVPQQYDPKTPACVLVFQDGARSTNPDGVLRVPQVLDNLIARNAIPVTIGIYITPGQRGSEFPESIGFGNPDNRDREYDVLDDNYAKMVIDEILPAVGAKYRLTQDPAGRVIGGSSSGAICAFTVAWHRPDQFRNVISLIGSFTNIHGGHVYPQRILENPTKPIRIFLQDGINDLRSPRDLDRDWYLQNVKMVEALTEKKYDMAHVFGEGGHSDDHGGAILPEMLQWIWRDYPGVQSKSAEQLVAQAKERAPIVVDLFPGFDAKASVPLGGKWQWESNQRGRRVERLVINREGDSWQGMVETTMQVNGEEQTSKTPIQNVELIGNKLLFDIERDFRGNKLVFTYQGIVAGDSITGWTLSEQNGTPRDVAWRAKRID